MHIIEGMSIIMRAPHNYASSVRATDLCVILNVRFAAKQWIYLIVGWRVAPGAEFLQCNMLFQLNDSSVDVGRTHILRQNDGCMLHKHDQRYACHLPEYHAPAWIVFVRW